MLCMISCSVASDSQKPCGFKPGNCSPGFSVHGIFQARILEWVAISYSRGSSQPRDRTHVSSVFCISRRILYHYATWEVLLIAYLQINLNMSLCDHLPAALPPAWGQWGEVHGADYGFRGPITLVKVLVLKCTNSVMLATYIASLCLLAYLENIVNTASQGWPKI